MWGMSGRSRPWMRMGWMRLEPICGLHATAGAVPTMPGQLIPQGGGLAQITPPLGVQQQNRNPDFSNVYKWYNNWNVCFLCGFNLENDHMSTMCPFCKMNHQQAYTRKNAQQFIVGGMTRAPRECTRLYYHWGGTTDGVGRRVCVTQINVTV